MNPVTKLLKRLNPEQYQAATSKSPVILVMAGAGSGKTSVLVSRIANLQVNERVGTSNMVCLTFTRLAAKEMKERVGRLIGDSLARNLTAGTFHAFCVRFLRQYGGYRDIDRFFSIYDEEDKLALLDAVIKDLRYTGKVKPSHVDPWNIAGAAPEIQAVAQEYRYRLQRNNAVDLDGLLYHTIYILEEHEHLRNELRRTYTHVFVDEYQDTDDRQECIIQLIKPENLFVVGDPSQAIYTWRGARIDNILTFADRHPGCEVIRLERNYRSTKPILDLANRTIARATHKSPLQLWTDKDGSEPELGIAHIDVEEAMLVAGKVAEIGEPWREIAVLCRTNAQVGLMQTVFEHGAIPTFVVSNRTDPLNAYDVRRVIDYVTYLCNPRNEWALRRIVNWPERRLSDLELQRIEHDALTSGRDLVDLIESHAGILASLEVAAMDSGGEVYGSAGVMWSWLVEHLRLEARYEREGLVNRIDQLESAGAAIERWEETQLAMGDRVDPHAFLAWLRTRDIQERFAQEEADGVRILTIHGAKGLEWDHVFVVGCNEDVLPSKRGDIEEERRLFYVAVTRARETLHMSYAHERETWGGKVKPFEPSRFLEVV